MKNKSDLKRKVLCSLLAASTMGIFYSSGAMAASVNGKPVDTDGNGIITETELVAAGSHHFIIGQGDKITVATDGNVNQLLEGIKAIKNDPNITDKLGAVRQLLAEHVNVGVVGGEAQFDSNFNNLLGLVNSVGGMAGLDDSQKALIEKVYNINTSKDENGNVINNLVKEGDTYLTIGTDDTSPVVVGAIGGDLSINTGLNGNITIKLNEAVTPVPLTAVETSITRNGNVNNVINSGNVIGGVGGSAAIALGNISGQATMSKDLAG